MAKRRKRGDGIVHLRKDGRWEGRVVIGYDDNGYPKTKNVLAKNKKECLQKLKVLKDSLKKVEPERLSSDMCFGAWLDHWYQNQCKPTIGAKTQTDYENRIYRHIIPEIGQIPLNRLTAADLQQFYRKLKQGGRLQAVEQYGSGLSDRMVKCCHVTCRTALDQAVKQGLILKNPADACKTPTLRPKEMQVLSPEEIRRLLIQARENDCYELLLLELSTGLRRGEILALQWDDLDLCTGILRIERQVQRVRRELVISAPKTKISCRSIILPAPILGVLRDYRQSIRSRWMFPSPKKEDSPLDPAVVRKKLAKVLNRADCKHIHFHDLRHPYVKHTTKIFSLRSMAFQAQAYPDARRKTRGACQLLRVGQSRSPVRPLCNRKRFSCLPPQAKMSWILYAISMRLSGYTSTRSISSSASSVVSVSASKIALDASLRLSCRVCSSCFCFACANTAA